MWNKLETPETTLPIDDASAYTDQTQNNLENNVIVPAHHS